MAYAISFNRHLFNAGVDYKLDEAYFYFCYYKLIKRGGQIWKIQY